MIMKKIIEICVICIFFFVSNTNASLTENDYKKVANNFLDYMNCKKTILSVDQLISNQQKIGRVFHLDNGGYLIIPETKVLPPIKGYSFKTNYGSLPKAYKRFICHELEMNQSHTNKQSVRADSINHDRWDFLLNHISSQRKNKKYMPDTFLLQTTWNQNYPYNKMLPKIDDTNVFAGCTQAAQAQIMKYHQHPKRGQGIATHTWNNQTYETILFRDYHWENMPNNVNNSTPEHIQDEVGLLYKDLAIVNKAEFGIDGTSSSVDEDAMYEYFGYATDIKHMTNENESAFFSTIRNEIDNQRPVLLNLPNHATVADGYASDQTGKKIHINMGWGGHDDDYYYLKETINTESFSFDVTTLEISYNIKPCNPEENNCFDRLSALEAEDIKEGFQISGKFNSENDIDTYNEYLKGPTKIIGDRGYKNQAFYIMIYNSNSELILSSDDPIEYDFPVDYYTIKVSLHYYYYDSYDTYDVSIHTESVSDIEMDIIQNQDNPPIINTDFTDQILSIGKEYQIRIDAVDKDGDIVLLSAISSSEIVDLNISDEVLTLTSTGNAGHAQIYVIARTNDKQTHKSFDVLVSDTTIGWGNEFKIKGTFENQNDYHMHQVLLENQCQITGDNGFSNQAFFTSVLDQNQNTILAMNDTPMNHHFIKSNYWIGASLMQNPEGGSEYYVYKPDHSTYEIFVNCPDASWTFQDIADILGIEIKHTNTLSLRYAILFLQILAGNSVADVKDLMFIHNITQIGMENVLHTLQYISKN